MLKLIMIILSLMISFASILRDHQIYGFLIILTSLVFLARNVHGTGRILTLLLLSIGSSEDPREILKLHQSSRDLLIVIVSAFILLILLQFQYKFWILRSLIIGFNIFLIIGYSIISLFFLSFQEKRLYWKLVLSVPVSLLIIIALGFLPLDNYGILRLSSIISIIAATLTYIRRSRRKSTIIKSLKEGEADQERFISASEAAKIAMKRIEKLETLDELERAFPPEEYFEIEKRKDMFQSKFYADTILIFLFTILTIISPIKWPFGIFFIILIPGYLLLNILAPKKGIINTFERLFLSFSLSIITSTFTGFIIGNLNLLDPNLIIAYCGLSLFLVIASIIIRSRIETNERFYWDPLKSIERINTMKLNRGQVISLFLVILLFSLVGVTINLALNPVPEKFTEFYILGPTGKAYDYPTELAVDESGEVIVGVVNHEYQTVKYRLIVKMGEDIMYNTSIGLKSGEKWEKRITFTPTSSGENQKLQFLLYRLPDESKAYRSLHLFLNVTG